MKTNTYIRTIIAITLLMPAIVVAQTTVPNTFVSGAPALASEVNENFDALVQGVQQLEVAAPVIDPTLVQTRVSGTCAVGSFISAIAEDGTVTCGDGSDEDLNTRYGALTLVNNTGDANTAIGDGALQFNTTGVLNTASGVDALGDNTDGSFNTASGVNALWHNITGDSNTATGMNALFSNTDGFQNTATGRAALFSNTDGFDNTATGRSALESNTTGNVNSASGAYALHLNTEGVANSADGHSALYSNTTGSFNTASGYESLWTNTIGSNNIAVGYQAGYDLTTGDRNIAIGNAGVAGDSNTIRVGNANHTRVFVHGIEGRTTGINDAVTVVIDSNGQLGTVSSSMRYKEDVSEMGSASGRLMDLNPVTFRYKDTYENGVTPLQYGLSAEEVAEVFPDLVVYNDDGRPETVKYRLLSSLLLNELQKQQSEVSGQVAEIAELKTQMTELTQLVNQLVLLDQYSNE